MYTDLLHDFNDISCSHWADHFTRWYTKTTTSSTHSLRLPSPRQTKHPEINLKNQYKLSYTRQESYASENQSKYLRALKWKMSRTRVLSLTSLENFQSLEAKLRLVNFNHLLKACIWPSLCFPTSCGQFPVLFPSLEFLLGPLLSEIMRKVWRNTHEIILINKTINNNTVAKLLENDKAKPPEPCPKPSSWWRERTYPPRQNLWLSEPPSPRLLLLFSQHDQHSIKSEEKKCQRNLNKIPN